MADIRDEIADFIADTPLGLGGLEAVMQAVAVRFPNATGADIDAGLYRAIDIIEARAAKHRAEFDVLMHIKTLFDGMPEGTPLEECARIKAERGDLIAIAFLEWVKEQHGGVQ